MRNAWLAWMGCLGMLAAAPAGAGGLKVTPNKENVVASRLEGKWAVEPKLTQRLYGQQSAAHPPGNEVEFTSDPAVAEKVPEKYLKPLEGRTVYMAGLMKTKEIKAKESVHPFILIELHGNPHLLYFRERDGDPMGDSESFNLILAVARNRIDDLLLTGGDFNNQPFSAFERVERREAK